MTDKQLFELIEKIVKERKNTVPHPSSENFAQKYCKQQLDKKKLHANNTKQKMNYLMKNFASLQTYFDMPQLLNQLNSLKLQEQTLKGLSSCAITTKHIQAQTPNKIINKRSGQFKNLRFVLEDKGLKDMLNEIEQDNEWKEQVLKNNSAFNLNTLYEQNMNNLQQKDSCKLFERLRNYREHPYTFVQNQNRNVKYKESLLNNEKNKIIKTFIHKVSSYLQIILETQHKNKWTNKNHKLRQSILKKDFSKSKFANLHSDHTHSKFKQKKNSFMIRKSFTKPLNIHQDTNFMKPKYIMNRKKTRNVRNQAEDENQGRRVNNLTYQNSTQSSQNLLSAIDYPIQTKTNLKETFTFRKRNIKQNIISKLDKFLGQIDEEQQCNRNENQYYHVQINRLETKYKSLYGKHRRQTLASQEDVKKIQMLVSGQKGSVMMSRKPSKVHNSVSSHSHLTPPTNINAQKSINQ